VVAASTMRSPIRTRAFSAVEPKLPVNARARTPETPSGSRTRIEAASIGTGHSVPVAFQ
jgi:hypothetical protein